MTMGRRSVAAALVVAGIPIALITAMAAAMADGGRWIGYRHRAGAVPMQSVGGASDAGVVDSGPADSGVPPFTATQSLRLDSTGDYVYHTDPADFDGSAHMTISLWFRIDTTWPSGVKVLVSHETTNQYLFVIYANSTGRIIFRPAVNLTTTSFSATSPNSTFAADVWYHLVCVYDGTGATNADKVQMYVNGSAITPTFGGTAPATLSSGSTANLQVGVTNVTSTPYPAGNMDEIAFWAGTSLTAGQVSEIYNGGTAAIDLNATSFADPTFWLRYEGDMTDSNGTADGTAQGNATTQAVVPW